MRSPAAHLRDQWGNELFAEEHGHVHPALGVPLITVEVETRMPGAIVQGVDLTPATARELGTALIAWADRRTVRFPNTDG